MLFGVVFHIIGLFFSLLHWYQTGRHYHFSWCVLVCIDWFYQTSNETSKMDPSKGDKNDGHLYHFRFLGAGKTTFYTKFTEANTEK